VYSGTVKPGLATLAESCPAWLRGARLGLVANPASVAFVEGRQRHAVGVLRSLDLRLVRLFSPEHGLYGSAQEGQEVKDGLDPHSGLAVISLYGARRAPEREHLADLEALVFDLQDVGVRVFTYLSTLKACLQRCAEAGILLVVLDRPNPLGRKRFGPGLSPGFESFVGAHDVRYGHGLTLGELAAQIAQDLGVASTLRVLPVTGWQGEPWHETGLPWLAPSPNLPSFSSAQLYPATVFFEGTNVSEGRGTAQPFRHLGAPWLDGFALAEALKARALPGLRVEAASFTPRRSKHQGLRVSGVSLQVTDWEHYEPVTTALALLSETRAQNPERFTWLKAGSRYLTDLLYGSDGLRLQVSAQPLAF
jgi:uncharacterized protein YbbC (DUF1343 family)